MKAKAILDYPLDKIKFDENNPNVTSERDEEASKAFLKKYDILRTVVVDSKGLCIDGEHIAKRALERGDTTIAVLQANPKNAGEVAEIRTFLNYGPRGKPNEQKFAEELEKIYKAGNMGGFAETMGKSVDEFRRSLEAMRPKDASEVPDVAPAIAKLGEIYQCGVHYVMCGDATDHDDIHQIFGMEKKTPRLLLTDPPYDFGSTSWIMPFFNGEIEIDNLEALVLNSDKPTVEMLMNIGSAFVGFYVITFNSPSRFANQPMISHRLISHYRRGRSNFQNLHDAFGTVHSIVLSKSGLTRHEKPLDLPRKLIIHYTKPEEVVLDIFAGSGSTMMACEQVGRICYCMEKDPHKVDIILKRYEDFTGDKAVKV